MNFLFVVLMNFSYLFLKLCIMDYFMYFNNFVGIFCYILLVFIFFLQFSDYVLIIGCGFIIFKINFSKLQFCDKIMKKLCQIRISFYCSHPAMEVCMYLYKFLLNPCYSLVIFSFVSLGSVKQNKIQLLASQACCYSHQETSLALNQIRYLALNSWTSAHFWTLVDKGLALMMTIN